MLLAGPRGDELVSTLIWPEAATPPLVLFVGSCLNCGIATSFLMNLLEKKFRRFLSITNGLISREKSAFSIALLNICIGFANLAPTNPMMTWSNPSLPFILTKWSINIFTGGYLTSTYLQGKFLETPERPFGCPFLCQRVPYSSTLRLPSCFGPSLLPHLTTQRQLCPGATLSRTRPLT